MKNKIRVGIIFGGKSSEHEVSLLSAQTVYESLDKEKYDPILIGIDKHGRWHLCDPLRFLAHTDDPRRVCLDGITEPLGIIPANDSSFLNVLNLEASNPAVDVVFPIVHGTHGEDGTLQGLLKLAGIPFVGAGVLGSAVGMDKDVMKRLLRDAGIPVTPFLTFHEFQKPILSFEQIVEQLGLPLFIKPANNGSSIGISKVNTKEEFDQAIELAFAYDRKILIEAFVQGREIECSIMGNHCPIASLPGEVVPKDDFNSWDAKYINDQCSFMIPARLDKDQIQQMQDIAIRTYQVLCCEGMARVDCFLTDAGKFIVNEINTLPGFTKLSVFPRLWQASGVSYSKLVDHLIEYALERNQKELVLKNSAFIN
jgi:D-alanine-D-alanine ligase